MIRTHREYSKFTKAGLRDSVAADFLIGERDSNFSWDNKVYEIRRANVQTYHIQNDKIVTTVLIIFQIPIDLENGSTSVNVQILIEVIIMHSFKDLA